MAKEASKSAGVVTGRSGGHSPVNTDELESALYEAERRVLKIQAKLHCWACHRAGDGCRGFSRRAAGLAEGP